VIEVPEHAGDFKEPWNDLAMRALAKWARKIVSTSLTRFW
jgi:hypothetical protein